MKKRLLILAFASLPWVAWAINNIPGNITPPNAPVNFQATPQPVYVISTSTPSNTATGSITPTPTYTATKTPTNTITNTVTNTCTNTPTSTPTPNWNTANTPVVIANSSATPNIYVANVQLGAAVVANNSPTPQIQVGAILENTVGLTAGQTISIGSTGTVGLAAGTTILDNNLLALTSPTPGTFANVRAYFGGTLPVSMTNNPVTATFNGTAQPVSLTQNVDPGTTIFAHTYTAVTTPVAAIAASSGNFYAMSCYFGNPTSTAEAVTFIVGANTMVFNIPANSNLVLPIKETVSNTPVSIAYSGGSTLLTVIDYCISAYQYGGTPP